MHGIDGELIARNVLVYAYYSPSYSCLEFWTTKVILGHLAT